MRHSVCMILFVVVVVLTGACNRQERLFLIEGVCTYNGDPVEGVVVLFASKSEKPDSTAYLVKDGRFMIIYRAGVNGIHAGEYAAFFQHDPNIGTMNEAGKSLVEKYPPTYSGLTPTGGVPFSVNADDKNFRWEISD